MFIDINGTVPWKAIYEITALVTYGGRVTDFWDQRCLSTILKRFYVPEVLNNDNKFSPSGLYFSPNVSSNKDLMEYVEGLPFSDDPEVFGMHENANISYERVQTGLLLDTILSIQPKTSGGSGEGKSPDDLVLEIAESMIEKLPNKKLDLDEVFEGCFDQDEKGRVQSLSTVLKQEVERFNGLLVRLWEWLANLKKAIKGLVVMDDLLEAIHRAFLFNKVPDAFMGAAYPSLKPLGSWIKDLLLRITMTDTWLHKGPPPSFWLSGFFYTQAFLTGSLQTHARKYNMPIDALDFEFVCQDFYLDQETFNPEENNYTGHEVPHHEDGVCIHGIFMDGMRWDDDLKMIQDSKLGVMFSELPVFHMEPKEHFIPPSEHYISPMYKTSVRKGVLSTTGHSTNFVVPMHLPSDQPRDYWIEKGAALLLMLDT
jgi:dynein heavy chain